MVAPGHRRSNSNSNSSGNTSTWRRRTTLLLPLVLLLLLLPQAAVRVHAVNHALVLNGNLQYLDLAEALQTVSIGGSMTIELWLFSRCPSDSTTQFVSLSNGAGYQDVWLGYETVEGVGTGHVAYTVDNTPSGTSGSVVSPSPLPTNRWVYVAITHDSASRTATLYFDGRIEAVATFDAPVAVQREYLYVGQSSRIGPERYIGIMDTLRVWTRALAGSEVQTNMYAVTVEATAASLLMAFRFEDVVPFEFEELNPANTNEVLENGYKFPIKDSSANAYDAVLRTYTDPRGAFVTTPESERSICGDGWRRLGVEACDDGNGVGGDGCSATCSVEAGYVCVGGEDGVNTDLCELGSVTFNAGFEGGAPDADLWTYTAAPRATSSWGVSPVVKHGGTYGLRMQHTATSAQPFLGCADVLANGNFRDGTWPDELVFASDAAGTVAVAAVDASVGGGEPTGSGYAAVFTATEPASQGTVMLRPRAVALPLPNNIVSYRLSALVYVNAAFGSTSVPLLHLQLHRADGSLIDSVAGGFPTVRDSWQRVAVTASGSIAPTSISIALGNITMTGTEARVYIAGVSVTGECVGIPGDMLAWHRSDQGLPQAADAEVTHWNDLSGNGHNLAPRTSDASSRPTVRTGDGQTLNGHPVVRWDGNLNSMQWPNDMLVTVPYTVFIVERFYTNPRRGFLVGGDTNNWLCGLWHSGTGFHPGTWVPSSSYKGFPSGQTYSWYIHACQALPESGYFWENGYNRNHGTQRTPTTLPGRMRLGGAAPHYDARSAAEVAEVLIYRRVLSDQEMYNVNAYLQQRYDIPWQADPNTMALVPAADVTHDFVQTSRLFSTFSTDARDYLSYAQRVIGSVTPTSVLSFSLRLETAPRVWGIPLWVILADTATALEPSDRCVIENCGDDSGRLVRVCFNAGDQHGSCDRVVVVETGTWQQQNWIVADLFEAKYGVASVPTSITLQVAMYAQDQDADTWLDDFAVIDYTLPASCATATAQSQGSHNVWATVPTGGAGTDVLQTDWRATTAPQGAVVTTDGTGGRDSLLIDGAVAWTNATTRVSTLRTFFNQRTLVMKLSVDALSQDSEPVLSMCHDTLSLSRGPNDGASLSFRYGPTSHAFFRDDASTAVLPINYTHFTGPSGDNLFQAARYRQLDDVPFSFTNTYAFWYKPVEIYSYWSNMFHRGSSSGTRQPAVWQYPGSTRLHIRIRAVSSTNHGCDPSMQLPVGVWTHVAIAYDETSVRVYYDGIQHCGNNLPSGLDELHDNKFYISDPWYGTTGGWYHDFRHYTTMLRQAQVQTLIQDTADAVLITANSAITVGGDAVTLRCEASRSTVSLYENGVLMAAVEASIKRTASSLSLLYSQVVAGESTTLRLSDVHVVEDKSAGAGQPFFCTATGSFLQYVPLPGATYAQAAAAAAGMRYQLQHGSLASVASAPENECAALLAAGSTVWLSSAWGGDPGAGGRGWRYDEGSAEAGAPLYSAVPWADAYAAVGSPAPAAGASAAYSHLVMNAHGSRSPDFRYGQWLPCDGVNCTDVDDVAGFLVEFAPPVEHVTNHATAIAGATVDSASAQAPSSPAGAFANLLTASDSGLLFAAGSATQTIVVDLGVERELTRIGARVVPGVGGSDASSTEPPAAGQVWDAFAVETSTVSASTGFLSWGSIGTAGDGVVDVLSSTPYLSAANLAATPVLPATRVVSQTARWVRYSFGAAASGAGVESGGTVLQLFADGVQDTYAHLEAGGVQISPDKPGLNVAIVDSQTAAVRAVDTFDVGASEGLLNLTTFLQTSVGSNDMVLAAAKDTTTAVELLFEESFDSLPSNNDLNRRMHINGYSFGYMQTAQASWSEAQQACSVFGAELCQTSEVCTATNVLPMGTRSGDSYLAVGDAFNKWVYIGNIDSSLRCKTFEEINGAPPTDVQNGDRTTSYALCCDVAPLHSRWRNVREAGNPYWRIYLSRMYHAYRTNSGTRCPSMTTNNVRRGSFTYLDENDAYAWTDYVFKSDIHVHDYDTGFLFRVQSDTTYYRLTYDVSSKCAALERFRDGDWKRLAVAPTGSLPVLKVRVWMTCAITVHTLAPSNNVSISVAFDGETILETVDDDGLGILSGSIGFQALYGYRNYWDDVRVTTYSSPLTAANANATAALAAVGLPFNKQLFGGTWAGIGSPGRSIGETPAASSQDGNAVSVRRQLACPTQTMRVPENSDPGRATSYPLRVHGVADPAGFVIRSAGNFGNAFRAAPGSGQIFVVHNLLDFEGRSRYQLSITCRLGGYDSGWIRMSSQFGEASFREVVHGLGGNPAQLDVQVQIRPTEGPNAGFVFQGTGTMFGSDSHAGRDYGGILFGFSSNAVRLWAPSRRRGYYNGFLVSVGPGWGGDYDSEGNFQGETNTQSTHNADVRVVVTPMRAADYDTGWLSMSANQGSASWRRVYHALGTLPARVKVLVRAPDGNNAGFVFEAAGNSQFGDRFSTLYGGACHSYTDEYIDVYLASRQYASASNPTGAGVAVGRGWAGNFMEQESEHVDVRVLAWRAHDLPPDFESNWMEFVSDDDVYQEVPHGLPSLPERVLTVMRPKSNPSMRLVATGMTQNSGRWYYIRYGGVIQGVNADAVRLWGPSRNPRITRAPSSRMINIGVGWGGERARLYEAVADVKVYAWSSITGINDVGNATVEVVDVQEPPTADNSRWAIAENPVYWEQLGTLAASDGDANSALTYTIVNGNVEGAFAIDPSRGNVSVANVAALNYEHHPSIAATVRISDGLLWTFASIVVEVENINDMPVLQQDAVIEVVEDSPVNTLVGSKINATDEDEDQTIFYSIIAGNDGDAFKISACDGQVRVRTAVLDYERQKQYNLTVQVIDDGVPALNVTALVVVNILNRNDPPEMFDQYRNVSEHAGAGADVGLPLTVVDQDGDPLTFTIAAGNEAGLFSLNQTTGQLRVVASDTLDYETTPSYTLVVVASDAEFNTDAVLTVYINDANDPPTWVRTSTEVPENSPAGTLLPRLIASDEDADDLVIYTLAKDVSGLGAFALHEDGVLEVIDASILDYETYPEILLLVNATDSGGPTPGMNLTSSALVRVLILNEDEPPYLNPGTYTVDENSPSGTLVAILDGGDEDADASVQWSILDGDDDGAFEITEDGNLTVFNAVLNYERQSQYVLWVMVEELAADAGGEETGSIDGGADPTANSGNRNATAYITVDVSDVNDPPIMTCDAGLPPAWELVAEVDAIAGLPSPTSADGVNTFNLGVLPTSTPDPVASCRDLCIATTDCAAFTYYGSGYVKPQWRRACVGRVASAGVWEVVAGAPITSGRATDICQRWSVPENQVPGALVGREMTYTDEDTANVINVTLSTVGNTGGAFALNSSGLTNPTEAQLTVAFPVSKLDYETKKSYFLSIVARDDAAPYAESTTLVEVVLEDVNEAPELPGSSVNASEGSPQFTQLLPAVPASDQDGNPITFSIAEDKSGLFGINATTGVLYVASASGLPLLGATSISYVVLVQATDGLLSGVGNTTVHIMNINNPPVIQNADVPRSVDENAPDNTLVTGEVVNATDKDDTDVITYSVTLAYDALYPLAVMPFDIHPTTGALYVVRGYLLDYEVRRSYTVLVTAQDSGEGLLSTQASIVIAVNNINETPQIEPATLQVAENSPAGTPVGGPQACYDDDGDALYFRITAGDPTNIFAVAQSLASFTDYQVTVARSGALDAEVQDVYYLTLEVNDGAEFTGRANYTTVTVEVVDVNEPPGLLPASFSVIENAPLGTKVGIMNATDPDTLTPAFRELRFTLSDPLGVFEIDSVTGEITVDKRNSLDYERRREHVVTVTVSDGPLETGGLTNSTDVVISVIDVNDITLEHFAGPASVAMATSGGQVIRLIGTNFGSLPPAPADPTTVTYGPTGTEYTAQGCVMAGTGQDLNTVLECTTVPGAGANQRWRLVIGQWSYMSTVTTSYAAPAITQVLNADDMATEGGETVTIVGTNLGPNVTVVTASYQSPLTPLYTTPRCIFTVPHSEVQCTSVAGVGRDHEWYVTAAGQTSARHTTSASAYVPPSITGLVADLLDTDGGSVVVIEGRDFGPAGDAATISATYGPGAGADRFTATDCAVVVPHTRISCSAAAGVGARHRWILTVADQASDVSVDETSYLAPVLLTVDGVGTLNGTTKGGQAVRLLGRFFGPASVGAVYRISYGSVASGADEYVAAACAVTSTGGAGTAGLDTMACQTAPGVGSDHAWKIEVEYQTSPILEADTSYGAPVVGSVAGPGTVSPTAGGTTVVIGGVNFGFDNAQVNDVTYGVDGREFRARGCSITVPHVEITCTTAPGAGVQLSWRVVVGEQSSVASTTQYALPSVTSISGTGSALASTDGGQTVVLDGSQFGPALAGGTRRRLFYSPPLGSDEWETSGPRNLAEDSYIDQVTYGPSGTEFFARNCDLTTPHTRITCTTAPGAGADLRWLVTIEGQVGEADVRTSYAAPAISDMTPVTADTQGGTRVTLTGTDFGYGTTLGTINFGDCIPVAPGGTASGSGFGCPAATSSSVSGAVDTIVFEVPEGNGTDIDVAVTLAGQRSVALRFDYNPPVIQSISVEEELAPGVPLSARKAAVTVRGNNFGASGYAQVEGLILGDDNVNYYGVARCDTDIPDYTSHNHTVIRCVAPMRTGNVTVVVGDRVSNRVEFYSYSPVIDTYSPRFSPTEGGGELTISGRYFGTIDTTTVSIAGTDAPINAAKSSFAPPGGSASATSTIVCTIPPGQGALQDLVVQVRALPSDPQAFDYLPPALDSVLVTGKAADVGWDTAGGEELTITGTNLGLTAYVVFNYSFPGVFVNVTNHRTIVTQTAAGMGRGVPLIVVVTNQWSNAYLANYLPPTVTGVVRTGTAVPTQGGTTVTVSGSNFGLFGVATIVYGTPFWVQPGGTGTGTPAQVTQRRLSCSAWGHTELTCTLPAGQGVNNAIVVTTGEQESPERSSTVQVSYDPPELDVDGCTPSHGPTSGLDYATGDAVWVTLRGRNFGESANITFAGSWDLSYTHDQRFDGDAIFYNSTTIVMRLPQGQGVEHDTTVDVSGQATTQLFRFSYDPPTLTGVTHAIEDKLPDGTAAHGPTDACHVFEDPAQWRARQREYFPLYQDRFCCEPAYLTLHGENFGVDMLALSLDGVPIVSPSDCVDTPAPDCRCADPDLCISLLTACRVRPHTHTAVQLLPPVGIGVNRTLELAVAGQKAPGMRFNFDAPIVTSVRDNPYDANGASIEVRGKNYGSDNIANANVSIVFRHLPCTDARVRVDLTGKKNFGMPYVTCNAQRDVAGPKNGSINIAQQTALFDDAISQCRKEYYGDEGQVCLPCPQGGLCPGKYELPTSLEKWWRFTLKQPNVNCPAGRAEFDTCIQIVPCEPPEACLANNTCNVGYTSDRCILCADGFFRLDGECEPCPNNPWIIAVVFIGAAIGAAIMGFVFNRKSVNLGIISIGVDYFQVLALFARAKVAWPSEIKAIFRAMSVFNLNLELTAPECSIPNLTYAEKWFAIQILPLAALTLFLLLHVLRLCHKRCIMRRKERLNSHAPALVGTVLTMFYYMYLYLSRVTLDVFNCNPTDPPDGAPHGYMEAVFEECYLEGGTHLLLLPWAVATLLVYTIGYPGLVGWILYRGREKCKEDQLLRAQGLGEKRTTNPRCYDFRKKYHKLYYNFKPSYCWFWILIVIARKAGIAFTSLMFRRNPAFQMSIALLVMFIAYSLQVKHSPYMSTSERQDVLEEHQRKVDKGSALHARLAKALADAKRRQRKSGRSATKLGDTRDSVSMAGFAQATSAYFYNYNTCEAVLLACAVFINLAGIMFESGHFDSGFYEGQKKTLTYIVMITVISSILYYVVVLFTEILFTFKPNACRRKNKKARRGSQASSRDLGKGEELGMGGGVGDAPELTFKHNPMLSSNMAAARAGVDSDQVHGVTAANLPPAPPGQAQWSLIRLRFQELEANHAKLKEELASRKQRLGTSGLMAVSRAAARFKKGMLGHKVGGRGGAAGAGAGAGAAPGAATAPTAQQKKRARRRSLGQQLSATLSAGLSSARRLKPGQRKPQKPTRARRRRKKDDAAAAAAGGDVELQSLSVAPASSSPQAVDSADTADGGRGWNEAEDPPRPTDAPEGWTVVFDSNYRAWYYYHEPTDRSEWTRPEE